MVLQTCGGTSQPDISLKDRLFQCNLSPCSTSPFRNSSTAVSSFPNLPFQHVFLVHVIDISTSNLQHIFVFLSASPRIASLYSFPSHCVPLSLHFPYCFHDPILLYVVQYASIYPLLANRNKTHVRELQSIFFDVLFVPKFPSKTLYFT